MCIRRLHGKLYRWKDKIKRKIFLWKYLSFPLGKKVYLIGTPTHTNIGDSAIVFAEILFLKRNGVPSERIKELTVEEIMEFEKLVLSKINKQQMLVCWHGGGNMGDLWLNEEYFRRHMLKKIISKFTIIFPQTIHYTNEEEARKSIDIYNTNEKLLLVAREKESYEIMKSMYPKANVILTPDIVLSSEESEYGINEYVRKEIVICLRNDIEKQLSRNAESYIMNIVENIKIPYKRIDMHANKPITKEKRLECIQEKMEEFKTARVVITDRLHGMVFSVITGTPCIVLSNNNHKVLGTYEWIKKLSYIRYVENVEEIEEQILKLLQIRECKYEKAMLGEHFQELISIIDDFGD